MRLPLSLAAITACVGLTALAAQMPTESPTNLVRQTVQNEIKSSSHARFMYLDRKQGSHDSQTRLVVETSDVSPEMLVARNDKPISPDERRAEELRLDALSRNPEELRKRQKADREETEHTMRIMKALPDAFLYEADGTEPGKQGVGRAGDSLVRLKFRPNPKYNAPSRVEQVLQGMQGYLLIDAQQHRIARIDGTLFKDVNFGWGILGHLDRGGHFLVEQGDVGKDDWEITRMDLAFSGKELLFKNLNIKSQELCSDFRQVPFNLTFTQGVELLKKQSPEVADNLPQENKSQ